MKLFRLLKSFNNTLVYAKDNFLYNLILIKIYSNKRLFYYLVINKLEFLNIEFFKPAIANI